MPYITEFLPDFRFSLSSPSVLKPQPYSFLPTGPLHMLLLPGRFHQHFPLPILFPLILEISAQLWASQRSLPWTLKLVNYLYYILSAPWTSPSKCYHGCNYTCAILKAIHFSFPIDCRLQKGKGNLPST